MSGPDAPAKVAEACCGIQSQNFQESLSSFWARIDGFRNNDVLSELKPGGQLVRTWAIRSTMHTIPCKEYYAYVLGGAGERMLNWIDSIAKRRNYPARNERERLIYQPVLDAIRGKAVTENEIKTLISERTHSIGLKKASWTGIGDMAFRGLLVHAGKRGSKSLYMRSDDWIPKLGSPPDRQFSRVELLRKYIGRHGPVSKADIMYWAYLTRQQVDEALSRLADDIVQLNFARSKEPYYTLRKDMDRKVPSTPQALVLPKYDSLMLTLRDKSRFMDMRYYRRVFGALGMVRPTVLVDGFVAGVWRKIVGNRAARIEVHLLKRIAKSDKKAVEERFSDYGKYARHDVSVKWVRGKWVDLPSR